MVAVSADDAARTADWAADEGIPFPLLTDPGARSITAWGLREEGEMRSVPALFVVDRQGRFRFRQIGESITDRAEIDDVLTVLTTP